MIFSLNLGLFGSFVLAWKKSDLNFSFVDSGLMSLQFNLWFLRWNDYTTSLLVSRVSRSVIDDQRTSGLLKMDRNILNLELDLKVDIFKAASVIIFPLIASILQLMILPFCHESPNYLKMIDREKFIAAKDFYGVACNQQDSSEKSEKKKTSKNNSISSLMKDPLFTKPLGIGCTMMLIQQLTGIRWVLWSEDGRDETKGWTGLG